MDSTNAMAKAEVMAKARHRDRRASVLTSAIVTLVMCIWMHIVFGAVSPLTLDFHLADMDTSVDPPRAIMHAPDSCPVTLQPDASFPLAQMHCNDMCLIQYITDEWTRGMAANAGVAIVYDIAIAQSKAHVLARNALAFATRFSGASANDHRTDPFEGVSMDDEEKFATLLREAGDFYDLSMVGSDNVIWAGIAELQGAAFSREQWVQVSVQIALAAIEYGVCVTTGASGWWNDTMVPIVGFDDRADFVSAASTPIVMGVHGLADRARACADSAQKQLDASWDVTLGEGPLNDASYMLPPAFGDLYAIPGSDDKFLDAALPQRDGEGVVGILEMWAESVFGTEVDAMSGAPIPALGGHVQGLVGWLRTIAIGECVKQYYEPRKTETRIVLIVVLVVLIVAWLNAALFAYLNPHALSTLFSFATFVVGVMSAILIAGIIAASPGNGATDVLRSDTTLHESTITIGTAMYAGMRGGWLFGAGIPGMLVAAGVWGLAVLTVPK